MTSVPQVFRSGAVLARAAGTEVHLLTVEAWEKRVVVRMAGAVNDAIRAELAGYEARMVAWLERRRAVGSRRERRRPPSCGGDRDRGGAVADIVLINAWYVEALCAHGITGSPGCVAGVRGSPSS
jgi:hypothetical protein